MPQTADKLLKKAQRKETGKKVIIFVVCVLMIVTLFLPYLSIFFK